MRPVLVDINQRSRRAPRSASALPLRWRLLPTLPLINVITGLIVAALTSTGGGRADLGARRRDRGRRRDDDLARADRSCSRSRSCARSPTCSRRPTQVVEGDFDAVGPGDHRRRDRRARRVVQRDGHRACAERERIRDAFGTYLDEEVAEYILSDGFSEEGSRARGLGPVLRRRRLHAASPAGAEAREVVAASTSSSRSSCRSIAADGGHVDKFEGDGLLAVFGAPRAVRRPRRPRASAPRSRSTAGSTSEGEAGDASSSASGVNTGRVVAGAIGGGGRLNFSVIGDAVNVAARVEAVTRETRATTCCSPTRRAARGRDDAELESRGEHELKGLERPVGALRAARGQPAEADAAARARPGRPGRLRRGDQPQALRQRLESAHGRDARDQEQTAVHGGRLAAAALKARAASTHLFTLSGGHLFSIYDGCSEEGIEIVDVRHEQAAAWAAEGWAKATRSPGVAALTAGPGVTNGMSAIAGALYNRSPVTVLGGRAPEMRWGSGSLQEIDHVPFVSPLVKSAETVKDPALIAEVTVAAIDRSLAAPSGPTFVDYPLDVVFMEAAAEPGADPGFDPGGRRRRRAGGRAPRRAPSGR